ncbi:30S ribosomal protein S2 [Patescibacteria group bacterium]|nr:30S ribosomal protein S2 [Patescibacteria group bacterium]
MNEKMLREMMENAVHFGHRSQKWNPKMKKFIFTKRDGVHVFDLNKTAANLEQGLKVITDSVKEGKKVLLVGTKPQVGNLVAETAKKCKMPYVISRWIPGLLTNFSTIKTRIKYLLDLKNKEESGELEKYTKKEAGKFKKEMEKLENSLGGVLELKDKPDVLFVLSAKRDMIAIKEANRLNMPIIAICDSDSDPNTVTYPIPGNDDSIKSIKYFLDRVSDAIESSKTKK